MSFFRLLPKKLPPVMTVGCALLVFTVPAMAADSDAAPRIAAVETRQDAPLPPPPRVSGEGIGAFLAGRQARKDGDTAAASSYYARALAADPQNEWLAHRSFLLDVSDGRMERALPLADRVLKMNPSEPVANLVKLTDHMRNERYGKAEALVAKADQRGTMQLLGPLVRAWAAFGAGDTDRALARLAPLEKKRSFGPFLYYHKALLQGASGDANAALETLDGLPGNMSLDLRSRLVYAALLGRRDGPEAVQAYLKGLSARYGEDPVLRAYLHHGRDIELAFPVRTAQDGMAEALYGAASALSTESINDPSMIYLRLALFIRPDLDIGYALLGDILEEAGHLEEAIDAFRAIGDSSPYEWSARIRIAWALDGLGRTEEAEAILLDMAAERQDNLTTLATLADMMRGHKRFEEAADVYRQTVNRIETPSSRHWSIFYAYGIALERSRRWEEAEKNLLKALELNPDQPLVMNYLGYSWADQGVKLEKAVAMIQKAVDLRPADGYVVDSLGWAYFQKGDYQTAVKHLERAAELRPEDPVINDHLGDAYWHVGRQRESCFQWRHALSLEPDPTLVPGIRAKMADGLGGSDAFGGCRF